MATFTARYGEALSLASRAHQGQFRKGTTIPYIYHPVAVSALVIEHGGDEDQAIAGLLHDVLEDADPGFGIEIRERFGDAIYGMVADLTDGSTDRETRAQISWQDRKEAYLEHLRHVSDRVLLVSVCDKLHNALAIAGDYLEVGEAVFERFSQPKPKTVWYYQSLYQIFAERDSETSRVSTRLRRAINAWA